MAAIRCAHRYIDGDAVIHATHGGHLTVCGWNALVCRLAPRFEDEIPTCLWCVANRRRQTFEPRPAPASTRHL